MQKTDYSAVKSERKLISRYVREVNKEIIATPGQKRKLFGDLKSDIRDRIADGKIANYENIVAHFGTPEQVAKDFFATANIKEIKKKLMIRRIIVSAVLFCVLLWFGVVSYLKYEAQNSIQTYTVESFEVDDEIVYEAVLIDDNRTDKTASLPHLEKENK